MSSLPKHACRQKTRSPHFSKALIEVETRIKENSAQFSPEYKAQKQHYVGTRLEVCGLASPAIRQLLQDAFSFQNCSDAEKFAVWNHIWKTSKIFEAKSLAGMFLESKCHDQDRMTYLSKAKTWVTELDNWCHSDALSKFYACCLEFDSATVLPLLQEWNRAKSPWKRRQSVVSLLYYSAGRKKYLTFNAMIVLVAQLLADTHFYVQRAVGWTLRELSNVYPAETLAFLQSHCCELSAHAFAAAVEKLPRSEKERLKSQRSRARKAKQL